MSTSGGSASAIGPSGTAAMLDWPQRILTVVSSLQLLTQDSHVDELRWLVHSASKSFLQSSTTSISILYAISLALSWQQPRRFHLPGGF